MNKWLLREQLKEFFKEDIGFGDRTSHCIFGQETAEVQYVAKEDGYFCGEDILREGYALINQNINWSLEKKDGDQFEAGDMIATVTGPVTDLLSSERVLLNLIQRMSGIATMTNKAAQRLQGVKTSVCDTRKTTPGLRMLEKHAVECGGGTNHRLRLDDGILIKDNHIASCGSITKAIEKARNRAGHMVKVEVEVEDEDSVKEAVLAGADVIMFDNCTPEQARQWQTFVPESIKTEVSGGIQLDQIEDYGKSGVDFISLGALTHSVKAVDISLNIRSEEL
ncbi:carboxylating nicotinate-nucleotide diphosphorylase [Evansella halocellulosilytica]|uniref:carboxylating nicotinate-nucleotide diphosphorylase n=1 Tax=Evansella halocellulosilytica TaxID=2011013 RepID=UPI000BB99564|nr:carboxylating nicotinate-nucleotide diphosphorylase [Evansella halocellulosilytica]